LSFDNYIPNHTRFPFSCQMINTLPFQSAFAIITLTEGGDRMSIMELALVLEKFGFGFNKLSYELLEEIKPGGHYLRSIQDFAVSVRGRTHNA